MKEQFITKNFSKNSLDVIGIANNIINEYLDQGIDLTLRQLYYQFVARDLIPNKQSEYKRLGSIINDARLAGYVDWYAIVDRTRYVRSLSHWNHPKEILQTAIKSFHMDKWKNQEYRPEVWIEKDALVGVIENVCNKYDVPYFSCRGYPSQSEIYRAGKRIEEYNYYGHIPIILHLGDHDPSGIDMTRDIEDRVRMFSKNPYIEVKRIALNMNQIERYNPPPNPAKITDSRFAKYVTTYGKDSWELDALDPSIIIELIKNELDFLRDPDQYNEKVEEENKHKNSLNKIIENWEDKNI